MMKPSRLSTKLVSIMLAALLLTGIMGISAASAAAVPAPMAITLDRTLRIGSAGNDVRAVQTILKQLGYYTGSIDGIFGTKTSDAVKAFQSRNGFYADGQVTNAVLQKMISSSAVPNGGGSATNPNRTYLMYGDTGTAVLNMQKALQALGYYTGALSGSFLTQTQSAVLAFQRRNGLTADGLAGQKTLTLLYSGKAIPNYYNPAPQPTYRPTPKPTPWPTATPQSQRTLRLGMSGDDVAAVQQRLYILGYYYGAINGYYDQNTVNAVKAFQLRNGLAGDGVVGPQTWYKMFASSAVPNGRPATPTPAPWYPPWPTQTPAPWYPPWPTQTPGQWYPPWPTQAPQPTRRPQPTRTPQPMPTRTPEPGPFVPPFIPITPTVQPIATPEPAPITLQTPRVNSNSNVLTIQPVNGARRYYVSLFVTDPTGATVPGTSKEFQTPMTTIRYSGEIIFGVAEHMVSGNTIHWVVWAIGESDTTSPSTTGSYTVP